jgi:hypothetical protein
MSLIKIIGIPYILAYSANDRIIQFHAIYEQEGVIPTSREFNLALPSDRLEVLGIVRNIAVLLPNLAHMNNAPHSLPECISIGKDYCA